MTDDDRVLITGAGPVGCTAALYLAKQGIPVTLVEACGSLPEDLRASTFHPPTLEMLDGLGIVEALIEQGLICPVWQYRDAKDGIVAEWDLSLLKNDTPHPYRVQAEQFKLTQIIVGVLSGMPEADVRFDARAVGVTQDASGVDLRVETQDGPAVLRGRYLIGADGASSVVRTSQDIEFPGLTFPELWLCVSTAYDFGAAVRKTGADRLCRGSRFLVRLCQGSRNVAVYSCRRYRAKPPNRWSQTRWCNHACTESVRMTTVTTSSIVPLTWCTSGSPTPTDADAFCLQVMPPISTTHSAVWG